MTRQQQLTSGDFNCILTNTSVWSHDGQWIYFDCRSDRSGSIFDSRAIKRVHVESREVQTVFEAKQDACVGVVTASPVDDRIVFIHGPENPTEDWQYNAYHRRGVILDFESGGNAHNLDACDLVSPYTPGALRGGSHVHVFSGDGRWISFTYEDHVLATAAMNPDYRGQRNQRNIGVAIPIGPVKVPTTHPRNHDGGFFCVLVSRTSDSPEPGSDQIDRACSDAWVGTDGYVKADGTRQLRAIAFIGDCKGRMGTTVPELFIANIPEECLIPGDGPLCGTCATRPTPPAGTTQRRLTFTEHRKFPGLGEVRHWPRSSPDGRLIVFLMRDDFGITQLWSISPTGTNLRQLTNNRVPVQSAFSVRPDGRAIACVIGGFVCEVDLETGSTVQLTEDWCSGSSPRPEAVVYDPRGEQIAFVRTVINQRRERNQLFIVQSGIGPT